MSEVLFYHLTQSSLEKALPGLLERCLERDWKVAVQAQNEAQRDHLDAHLWTYRDDSFLPHGSEGGQDVDPAHHPVWLTCSADNPGEAAVRFVIGASVPVGTETYQRVIYLFDGNDEEAVSAARERWKIEKNAGHELTYWQQDEQGRWRKAA